MSETTTLDYSPRMKENSPNKLNYGRTVLLSLSFFTVLMAWAYFNFKVPRIIDSFTANMPNLTIPETVKGMILAIDNFVAVIFQPFFGEVSDRTRSKFGRRMPYIFAGTLLAAIFYVAIPLVKFFAGLVLIIFFFDLSMAIYRSVSIAIIPDYTSDKFRSIASSIQQFIANMGGVIAFIIPTLIKVAGIPEFITEGSETIQNPTFNIMGFVVIAAIMILALIVQMIYIKETPTGDTAFKVGKTFISLDPLNFRISEVAKPENSEEKPSVFKLIGEIFKAPDKSFRNMLFVVFFAYTGFAAVEAFFSTFAKAYMGKADAVSGTLFLAYSGPMILTAFFWGFLGQKIGRKKAANIGLIGVIISVLVMIIFLVPNIYNPVEVPEESLTQKDLLVMLNLAFISMPWMCFIVNSFPIIWKLAPEGKIGSYTGVYYAFNQFAYTWAPILLGVNLDFFRDLGAKQYVVMWPLVLVCMIISFLFMFGVKSGEAEK